MGNITIKILAKELNLSVATISKALRDSHEISADTKQRVLALAAKLNYVPNAYAGSLRKRKSKTIAVVLPEVADSFFSVAINGIQAAAQQKGYHVLIYLTHESYAKEKEILKDFQGGRVDGVLMSITSETTAAAHILELHSMGVPIVFFDRVCEDIDTAKITTDDFEGGYRATQHLIDCGCRNISLLSVSTSLSISHKRMEGYKQAMSDNKLRFKASNIIHGVSDEAKNCLLIKQALAKKPVPDGIIATVEKFITPVYLAAQELGLSIPHQLKVIGFSNLPSAPILNPSLTTITQPAFAMGNTAANLLFKALDKKTFNLKKESAVLPSALIIRGSTQIDAT